MTGASYVLPLTLNTSVRYYWRVYADNACGTAGPSATWSFTTLAAPGDCTLGALPNALLSEGFEGGANGWMLGFIKWWVAFGPIGLHIALMVAIVMLPIVFALFLIGRMFLDAGHVAQIVVDGTTPPRFRR